MREIRPSQPDDQENIDNAFLLIMDLMGNHPEIEPTLWCGAVWSVLANGYRECDFSYEEFSQEVINISKYYKCWWDQEEKDEDFSESTKEVLEKTYWIPPKDQS